MVEPSVPKAVPGAYNSIAAQYARAKAIQDAEDEQTARQIRESQALNKRGKPKSTMERLNEKKEERFKREWIWVVVFFLWLLYVPLVYETSRSRLFYELKLMLLDLGLYTYQAFISSPRASCSHALSWKRSPPAPNPQLRSATHSRMQGHHKGVVGIPKPSTRL